MKKMIYEILNEVEKASNVADKIAILRKNNDNTALKTYMTWALVPTIEWNLPEGRPPFKVLKTEPGTGESNLYMELRRLVRLLKGAPNELKGKTLVRESLFISILEMLEEPEAEFLLAVKDKETAKLYPTINKALLNEAFPEMRL
jgi:hypothetical protein